MKSLTTIRTRPARTLDCLGLPEQKARALLKLHQHYRHNALDVPIGERNEPRRIHHRRYQLRHRARRHWQDRSLPHPAGSRDHRAPLKTWHTFACLIVAAVVYYFVGKLILLIAGFILFVRGNGGRKRR
jgi:hypothetical protein